MASLPQCVPSWLYVVTNGSAFKIGRTSNLTSRIDMIQTGSPTRIRIVAAMKVRHAVNVERHFHEKFAARRLSGEWYSLVDGDLIYIDDWFQDETIHWEEVCCGGY